jgi:hypothetical protein
LEDELDDNLDDIAQATRNLKNLGLAMGQELDSQNVRIGRIDEKAVGLDNRIFANTSRVCRSVIIVVFHPDLHVMHSSRRSISCGGVLSTVEYYLYQVLWDLGLNYVASLGVRA